MSSWATVLLAAGAGYALKLAGYVVPRRYLEGPYVSRLVGLLPVALLAGLLATQTFTTGTALAVDARAAAVLVAVVALALRAPFLLVVLLAAATAAALRALGWG